MRGILLSRLDRKRLAAGIAFTGPARFGHGRAGRMRATGIGLLREQAPFPIRIVGISAGAGQHQDNQLSLIASRQGVGPIAEPIHDDGIFRTKARTLRSPLRDTRRARSTLPKLAQWRGRSFIRPCAQVALATQSIIAVAHEARIYPLVKAPLVLGRVLRPLSSLRPRAAGRGARSPTSGLRRG